MQMMNDPFASLQQFGGGFGNGYMPQQFAGPSGFAGDQGMGQGMGQGMFGQKKKPFNPMMFGMGLLPGLLAQHPDYALPSLFGAAGLGLHALKVF